MTPFRYQRATDAATALSLLASHPEAAFIAGGTTLLDLMKDGIERPRVLVDINALPLARIEANEQGVRIGAMVCNTDAARDPELARRFPVLSEAILAGASPQLRNMATMGGNLLQRTRCLYFRDPATRCNKREPGAGCDAMHGINRGNAVLGTSPSCIATHPSDMAVALVALDASVAITGPAGPREIPIGDFFLLPGANPERETVLAHGELITTVFVPDLPPGVRSAYRKLRDRASYAFALASCAAVLHVEDATIRTARIALGGVGTKPWRVDPAVEASLVGQPPSEPLFAQAAELALSGAVPREHNAFKIELARRLITATLSELAA